ncbi:MAG: exo-alpha-sialidase [Ruminococcaceae bacterium]|nr:exo-alpha-sialidase [Oscillospiraceae bacterium]
METVTPKREHYIINRPENLIFNYHGWPSVCRDERGVLYAVASSHRLSHICPFGLTAMYMSFNEGKTWTPPIIVNDTELDDRDAGIIYMGGGRLLVTWFTHPADVYRTKYRDFIVNSSKPYMAGVSEAILDETYAALPEEKRQGGSYVRISEDYGVTWSEKIKVPVSAPHGPSLMTDGTLLYLGKNHYGAASELAEGGIGAYRSRDFGRTWEFVSALTSPDGLTWNNLHEPHVIDLGNGHLLGAIRAQGDEVPFGSTMYITHSHDNGASWSDMECVNEYGLPPHLLLHSSGKVILSYGKRGDAPVGERALVSSDGGRTWDKMYLLDDRAPSPDYGDLGYPATAELADGSLLTVYYQKHGGDSFPSLLATRWEL